MPSNFYTSRPDDPDLEEKDDVVKREWIGEGNKAVAKLKFLKEGVVLATTPGRDV